MSNPQKEIMGWVFGPLIVIKNLGSIADKQNVVRSLWLVKCLYCEHEEEIIYLRFITAKYFKCINCKVREKSVPYHKKHKVKAPTIFGVCDYLE